MTGITSEEGVLKTAGILSNLKLTKDLVDKWEKVLPLTFYYDHLSEQEILELNVVIYDYYHKGGFLGDNEGNLTKV